MRTQIVKTGETNKGHNANGHMAHIHNREYLNNPLNRPGKSMAHVEAALPENTKRPDSKSTAFQGSTWITRGTFTVNVPGNGFANAPRFFLGSQWITKGTFTANMAIVTPSMTIFREQS